MSFQSFATGMFSAADLQGLREKSGKSETLLALGQQVRKARKDAQLERNAVAARCGINAERLGRFEHGMSDMDFQSLEKLCGLLGLDVYDLLSVHMQMKVDTARTLINLARSWTGNGKPLTVEALITMPDPDPAGQTE